MVGVKKKIYEVFKLRKSHFASVVLDPLTSFRAIKVENKFFT